MKILLLEDNKTLNEAITLRLEEKNYEVYTYVDGKDALENINEGFSCFILDINVPNVDGIKILKKIREFYETVPVIIISATVELEIIKESYDFGCNDYIKKPFFIDELEIKIEKICNIDNKKLEYYKNCYFNFNESILIIENENIKLTKKENLMINLFLINRTKLVSYESIQGYVWEGEFASLDAIRTLIKRLRKKVKYSTIDAISNRGYIFK